MELSPNKITQAEGVSQTKINDPVGVAGKGRKLAEKTFLWDRDGKITKIVTIELPSWGKSQIRKEKGERGGGRVIPKVNCMAPCPGKISSGSLRARDRELVLDALLS